jgi:hypothetical protein
MEEIFPIIMRKPKWDVVTRFIASPPEAPRPSSLRRGFLFLDLGHGYLTAQRRPHVETLDCFCKGLALVVGVDSSDVL